MPGRQDTVLQLLNDAAAGREDASSELLPIVYAELRALAESMFRNERKHHTLQATALVHEAYMRLVDQKSVKWESRNQFFFLAARAMRNVLIDHARGRDRLKRGGGWQRVTLEAASPTPEKDGVDVEALDEALRALAELDERKGRLVELRFFGGLTSEEAAAILGISRTTAAEDWRMARAWLYKRLAEQSSE